jgi:hypothetical protein
LFFVVSRGAALGGGDVKVLLVLGAWLGPALGVEVELWSFVLLLAVTMARQLRDGNLGAFMQRSFSIRALRGVPTLEAESASFQGSPSSIQVRFGPYLAVVTCLSCLGIWFVRLLPGWAGELFY